jgi:hypothetical protein
VPDHNTKPIDIIFFEPAHAYHLIWPCLVNGHQSFARRFRTCQFFSPQRRLNVDDQYHQDATTGSEVIIEFYAVLLFTITVDNKKG